MECAAAGVAAHLPHFPSRSSRISPAIIFQATFNFVKLELTHKINKTLFHFY
jgi:hypothetical protein